MRCFPRLILILFFSNSSLAQNGLSQSDYRLIYNNNQRNSHTSPELFYPPKSLGRPVPPDELVRCLVEVQVQFRGPHKKWINPNNGWIVINRDLVQDVIAVFKLMESIQFPVTTVIPINSLQFNWSDQVSMEHDNTSAYNYRTQIQSSKLSMHALGRAIDINPKCNPYVAGSFVAPQGAIYDPRSPCALSYLNPKGRQVIQKMKSLGWTWGGDWRGAKDYQHFEKPQKYATGGSKRYCR